MNEHEQGDERELDDTDTLEPRTDARRRHAMLASACRELGVPIPRFRARARAWIARVVRELSSKSCDPLHRTRAERYLDAAWRAAVLGDRETVERMLLGARTMIRVGDEHAEAFESGDYDALDGGLAAITSAIREPHGIDRAEPEASLVVYTLVDRGPQIDDAMWMAGVGLVADAYVLDDGAWREGHERLFDAIEAAGDWEARRMQPGRGLPYPDSVSREEERIARAEDPAATPGELAQLALDPSEDVRFAALKSPRLRPADARIAVEHVDYDLGVRLAAEPALPSALVDALATSSTDEVRRDLVLGGHLTEVVLDMLRTRAPVRAKVVEHIYYSGKRLDPRALEILMADPMLREDVIEHLPAELAAQFADEDDEDDEPSAANRQP